MNQPTRHLLFPIESPDRLRQIWNQLPVTSKARLQQHLVIGLNDPSKMEFWPSRRQTESPLSRSKAVSNESVGTPRMSGKN